MTTKPGLYVHHKGGRYRVLFTVRDSTNGSGEGRQMVVYVSMTTGMILVREEVQFNELVGGIPRFTLVMEDKP